MLSTSDLASSANTNYADLSVKEFRKVLDQHVECLNCTLKSMPAEQVRIHVCWGNYEGPHHRDIALSDIIDIVLKVKATGITIESANPRHGHEWKVWEERKLPEEKILFPGVIDDTTWFIEHPETRCRAHRPLRQARRQRERDRLHRLRPAPSSRCQSGPCQTLRSERGSKIGEPELWH